MKRIVFLFLSLILFGQSFAQTQAELTNILAAPAGNAAITGAAGQTAVGQNIMLATAGAGWIDTQPGGAGVISYNSATVQVIGTSGISAGIVNIEGSNDGVTANQIVYYDDATSSGAIITTGTTISASTNRFFFFYIKYRYIRARITTAFVGGSVSCFTRLSPIAPPLNILPVAQATAGNLNANINSISGYIASAAASDATANPTGGGLRMFGHLFNGATWDRPYNNTNTTTGETGAKTATFSGATQTNFNAKGAIITCLVGTVSGTSPTMTLQLQTSPDGGTTWYSIGAPTTALTASGSVALFYYPTNWSQGAGSTPAVLGNLGYSQASFFNMVLPRTWRIQYTIGGTTPSFTITSVGVQYLN
jgi:hypothetical protein